MAKNKETWNRWGKRLGVIVAAVTLFSALFAGGEWIYDKLRRTPRLIVREQQFTDAGTSVKFNVRFTVANPAGEPLYINAMYFSEGPLTVATGLGASTQVPEFHDRIHLSRVVLSELQSSRVYPPTATPSSKNKARDFVHHRIFDGPRMRVDPSEQLDYKLSIDVAWPHDIDRKKLHDPEIQGRLVLEWENVSGKRSFKHVVCNLLL